MNRKQRKEVERRGKERHKIFINIENVYMAENSQRSETQIYSRKVNMDNECVTCIMYKLYVNKMEVADRMVN